IVAAASFDGGATWHAAPIPGLTACAGGPVNRASDPWLSFGPDGRLYAVALVLDTTRERLGPDSFAASGMFVSTSSDGGLTWAPPQNLILEWDGPLHDKQALTADPTAPGVAYAIWDRYETHGDRVGAPAVFTRTTDGGR